MESKHSAKILELIDGVVGPPEIEDVQEIIMPQLELVVALSGMERVFDKQGKKDFYDTHHLFFPRCDYTTPLEKKFRKAFVLPIHRAIHDEVHAKIAPPQKPGRSAMRAYLNSLAAADEPLA